MNENLQTGTQKNNTLESILHHQLENTRLFLDLLEREQKLLVAGNVEELTLLVTDKERVVHQLAHLDVQINQHLTAAGLSKGIQGIKSWIAANQSKPFVVREWEELLSLTRRARQLNQTNANIVSTQLKHTRQTLNALHDATGHTALYDPKGKIT
jgi:flagella synthesis protein FlgN